ncbi:hypothetical protein FO440_14770 [Mucilaginibacter corticis]|uniref:SGNH/GDSL hydrolase family protein n=1 Tax=Mucilaginibacter corticis TaxID=2597670 RepID=A0A556MM39_9SPHI|nr:hypothetical protein [Mucilaginibacter corticis]TSJ40994.1 hypothetical protein FO440_14770 [Mucilaginibacter corticis]
MTATAPAQVKKFMKVFLIVLAGIVVADQLTGRWLEHLYHRQRSGLLYRTSYAIDSTRANYIVLGSSRANHDYDPHVFEKILKTSFYNCGRDKQGALYSCAVLSAILERYKPRCILIDVTPGEFTQSDEGTLSTLLPYYHNPAVQPFARLNSHFENVKMLSRIYPYNSLLSNLLAGLNKSHKEDYKGYVKLTETAANDAIVPYMENQTVDTLKLAEFTRMLAKVNALRIPTFLIISPIRYRYTSFATVKACRSFTRQFDQVSFLDFTNRADWENAAEYSDNNHLNQFGAARYSGVIAAYLLNHQSLARVP